MLKIGIMQGRLLPLNSAEYQHFPKDTWQEEFRLAKDLGFDSIELLFDSYDYGNNPLLDNNLIPKIISLMNDTGLTIESVCADYFKVNCLLNVTQDRKGKHINILKLLISNCAAIGIKRIIVPLVETAGIKNTAEMIEFRDTVSKLYTSLKKHHISLSLETELDASGNLEFMNIMDCENINLQYDLGNSVSFGFDIIEDITRLKDFIAGIHIKDKDAFGRNVMLGMGLLDLKRSLRLIKDLDVVDSFILETFMGDNPYELASKQLKLVQEALR